MAEMIMAMVGMITTSVLAVTVTVQDVTDIMANAKTADATRITVTEEEIASKEALTTTGIAIRSLT
jgi:hypothetical protein